MQSIDDIGLIKQLGANVRKNRVSRNLSQAQLAFEIGCTLRQVQGIEAGESKVNVLLFIKIATALNIDMNVLCLLD